MTDILEQLRFGSKVALAMHMTGHEQLNAWEVMLDAAREIERLREEVADWKDRYEAMQQAIQANDEHIDRMLNEGGL